MLPATILEEEEQESNSGSTPVAPRSPSPANYISSLVSKSSSLLSNLKKSCSNYLPSSAGNMAAQQQQESPMKKRDISERQLSDSSFFSQTIQLQESNKEDAPEQVISNELAKTQQAFTMLSQSSLRPDSNKSARPPLPPPPPRELVASVIGAGALNQNQQNRSLVLTHSLDVGSAANNQSVVVASREQTHSTPTSGRRHAIQEQSLERDAALSFRIQQQKEHKHKRTSSIKSALRHAHLGQLSRHSGDKYKTGTGDKSDKDRDSTELARSMPYELFEPPVTQRTFERSRRRDAMLSDPKRQLSADTIGLRQLTDEYLHNAGVKPMSSSGQYSLVALGGSGSGVQGAGSLAGIISTTMDSSSDPSNGVIPAKAVGQQPACSIETQLYQASKHMLCRNPAYQNSNGSEDSLSYVVVSPGALPWQSDVSIQCELLQAPLMTEPYETTGDILNTLALPFKGSSMQLADISGNNNAGSDGTHQLSATLKRGLSAVINPHHHLTPTAALQVVGGNLKKSLSNTLDIAGHSSQALHLHSQDSLPAYSYLQNETDCVTNEQIRWHQEAEEEESGSGGLMSHIASKLGRQSSKKFTVSKKGLHRALSFDCRGYKRLEGSQPTQASQQNSSSKHLLATSCKMRAHNRSTLGLNSDHSPRPYLPQSASQVDFQLPLLPYHKMQEAIVSQRLLEPPKPNAQGAKEQAGSGYTNQRGEPKVDADQLLCAQPAKDLTPAVEPRRTVVNSQISNDSWYRKESSSSGGAGGAPGQRASALDARRSTAPRLILDIPTITMPNSVNLSSLVHQHNELNNNDCHSQKRDQANESNSKGSGEEEDEGEEADANGPKGKVIVCLPSPNVAIESPFNAISTSPSFYIDPRNNKSNLAEGQFNNQLSASDVFSRSQSLIKRPSTFLVSDAMSQVARALNSTSPAAAAAANEQQQNSVLRNRRQAIVPPKLATDGGNSDGEPQVGNLVDVEGSEQQETEEARAKASLVRVGHRHREDEQELRAHRRKRSGGSGGVNIGKGLSGSQGTLPTFHIEQDAEDVGQRPESQATNVESLVSSGSSTNLSAAGRCSASGGEFTVTSPGGLTVSFNSSRGRRRSSIAVIPQMQICPGDLLVYSKQLIDRMNQDESESEPSAQFLTIDDKKAKNIWSSLKLCAQFDSRTMKARNELLCSLEDVLSSLQPSTFVDEQLSHYKGMPWEDLLFENESRRSASSDALSQAGERNNYYDEVVNLNPKEEDQGDSTNDTNIFAIGVDESGSNRETPGSKRGSFNAREGLKVSVSSGTASHSSTPQYHHQQTTRSRDTAVRTITSRFREKPKLKRGQTVDSVFRIPLIPSSPLKHAQQHQQTPTAHLEDHDNILVTIEDDERSSINSSESMILTGSRHNRSSSTRSRTGSARFRVHNKDQFNNNPDSSFDTDDAADLINRNSSNQTHKGSSGHQFMRQSSLSTLSSTITRTEQKRQRALWDLFQSECTFFFDHLLTLKNVYMEPLKKIQVEGFAMFADPDILFGNLDELCCGVYDFCKEFLYIIMRTLKTRPEELNATDVLIKLYKKNPKIDHLRGVYHRYTLNYINALTYLESLRKQVEFVEFEKWSSRDVRCKKLQLTDLLVAPVQHIMRVPIILKDIESHTENIRDRNEIRAILSVEESSLRELDDKMRWLKNFERLLEIQKNISWPSVIELDPKLFIPEFLKEVLSKQPCERLIVSPRRQIVHEGTLSNLDSGKPSDMHVILFDDMLLLTRRKKGLTKKASTVCKSNSGGTATKDDGSFKYIVYKQPLSLDRFYVHDVQQVDSQSIGLKHLFLLIVMNRFQQISNVHSFSAPNDDIKQTFLYKIKKTAERWKEEQRGRTIEETVTPIPPQLTANTSTRASLKSSDVPGSSRASAGVEEGNFGKRQEAETSSSSRERAITIQSVEHQNHQSIELIVTSASTASAH